MIGNILYLQSIVFVPKHISNKIKQKNRLKYDIKIEGVLFGKRKRFHGGGRNRAREDNREVDIIKFTILMHENTIMNSTIL